MNLTNCSAGILSGVSSVSGTDLGADEQVGDTGCVLLQLGHPFLSHILETGRINHREADEEDVGHRVGQRPQAVVVLLQENRTQMGDTGEDERSGQRRTKEPMTHFHFLISEKLLFMNN